MRSTTLSYVLGASLLAAALAPACDSDDGDSAPGDTVSAGEDVADSEEPPDADVAEDVAAEDTVYADLGSAPVSGHAFSFAPGGGVIVGATIRVAELPERAATTGEDGAWRFEDLPVGRALSFVIEADEHVASKTAALTVAAGGLERVSFQVPTPDMYDLMALAAQVEPDPERCQIATTVTRRGHSLYTPGHTHGEPGATVTIDPPLPAEHGPIYFNLVSYDVIYPDPELEETTDDGGVLFLNVPPGDYVLRADKEGAVIEERLMRCEAGILVNAAPPWGLQVTEGGLEP